jgi:hypothetical protein
MSGPFYLRECNPVPIIQEGVWALGVAENFASISIFYLPYVARVVSFVSLELFLY